MVPISPNDQISFYSVFSDREGGALDDKHYRISTTNSSLTVWENYKMAAYDVEELY